MNCFLHPDKRAAGHLTVPCAPDGKIYLCAECMADPERLEKTWAKYKQTHAQTISIFKAPLNPAN
jgi:hypothetical protein